MLRAIEHFPASAWPADMAMDSLMLDFDTRHRRRLTLTTAQGEQILLDLPKAVAMANGDGLRLEDGRWLLVTAAPEAVIEVRAGNAVQLARIAWHLGNRHLPAEIGEHVIRIRPDHVIEAMLERLGAKIVHVSAPFQPEGGAYGGNHSHTRHDHGHEHDHGHGHSHRHDHDH
jgi:urease accessory protein